MGIRLDSALVQQGLLPSREKAKEAVKNGQVFVDGVQARKPSANVSETSVLEVRGPVLKFVGRGGLKLEKALHVFDLDITGLTCADVGASTGGFTDCMLQAGAAHVFAIDVGHDQLAQRLLEDERVTNFEGLDARSVTCDHLGGSVSFAATDVSFISLEKILPSMADIMADGAHAVCLIKPQFEAGRGKVGKKGVVKDVRVHEEVIERILACACTTGLTPMGLDYSPITGPEGNIEYLLHVVKTKDGFAGDTISVTTVVRAAHGALTS